MITITEAVSKPIESRIEKVKTEYLNILNAFLIFIINIIKKLI